MSDPFIGEIRMAGFSFTIENWAYCDGTVLSLSQFHALFAIISTFYGGDGHMTFALPDLRGRAVAGFGAGPGLSQYMLGQKAGTVQGQLDEKSLPEHTHQVLAAQARGSNTAGEPARDAVLAPSLPDRLYKQVTSDHDLYDAAPMHGKFITHSTGGNQPHDNLQPCLAVNFIIALHGTYPPRS